MISQVIAILQIAIDRLEETNQALSVAQDRIGINETSGEANVHSAVIQALTVSEAAQDAIGTVFTEGPDVAVGERLMAMAIDLRDKVEDTRGMLGQVHHLTDEATVQAMAMVEVANAYLAALQANYGG